MKLDLKLRIKQYADAKNDVTDILDTFHKAGLEATTHTYVTEEGLIRVIVDVATYDQAYDCKDAAGLIRKLADILESVKESK